MYSSHTYRCSCGCGRIRCIRLVKSHRSIRWRQHHVDAEKTSPLAAVRSSHGFFGWAIHHVPVQDQFWLILAQVPFAYLLDMGLSWLRYGNYRFGFGPLPIIGSINLFLWMTDSWFSIQYVMVALAF